MDHQAAYAKALKAKQALQTELEEHVTALVGKLLQGTFPTATALNVQYEAENSSDGIGFYIIDRVTVLAGEAELWSDYFYEMSNELHDKLIELLGSVGWDYRLEEGDPLLISWASDESQDA